MVGRLVQVSTRTGALRRAWHLADAAARRELRWLLAMAVIGSLAVVAQLAAGKQLVDLIAAEGSTVSDLVPWLITIGAALVVATITASWVGELQLLLNDLVLREAMGEILAVAAIAEPEQYEMPGFHDDLERARQSVQRHSVAIVQAIVAVATSGLSAIAVLIVVAVVAPVLVPIAAIAYIPLSLAQVLNNRGFYAMRYELTEIDRDRQYHESLLTGRSEVGDLRAFALTDHLRSSYRRLFDERVTRMRRLVSIRSRRTFLASLISSSVLVGTISAAMVLAVNGTVSVGSAAVAVVGFQQLADRFRLLGSAMGKLHEGVLFLDDFERFKSANPVGVAETPTGSASLPEQVDQVSVTGLGYKYHGSEHMALEQVSIDLVRGEVLAIVGPNGSGKSTFARLLSGIYRPTHGTMTWDAIDVGSVPLQTVRERVAPVFQDVTHFQFSVRDNIRFGDLPRSDDSGVERAAGAAGVHNFTLALPLGYQTRLGKVFEGSADISIGQWQRIAMARAFYRDAPVVVLDEPAAAVDPKQEADLFDRLRTLGRDRITVFVSHRFSTVRTADRVLVLDRGKVRELGTHEELMANGDLYAEMFTLQASRYQSRD